MAFLPTVRSIVYIPESNEPYVQIPLVALNLHPVLGIVAAAGRLGVSERSLRSALESRRLAHFRIDDRTFINEGDLGSYYIRRCCGEV